MVKKQTIQSEFYTPTGAPPAGCSVIPGLNNPQRGSASEVAVSSARTRLYHAEVDQRESHPGQEFLVANETRVFVLSNKNEPLMPCKPRKARKLLEEGKAVVVSARPFFTIKLNYETGGRTQPITLGVDCGYAFIGFALVGLVCYAVGQIKLDNKMSSRLSDRAMYRRSRRNRKCRYRPARFDNRASSRRAGKLPPSVERRISRHIKTIEKLKSICPVSEVRIEGASFDIQKLNDPNISGVGYQQGVLHRINLRNYLFARENGLCQYCGKQIQKGERIEMHHIRQRSEGGTDKPSNMALLHEKCHRTMHAKNDFSKLKKNKQYKAETFMNILRKRLFEHFPDVIETFGYETSAKRNELGLPKVHYIDAFVIAGGTAQSIPKPLRLAERRRNNRSLQVQKPGKQIAIRRKRYAIQPGDLVWFGKKRYVSRGSGGLGKGIWITKDGKKTFVSVSKITRVYHFGTLGFEQ